MARLFHALRIAYSGAVAGFRFGWYYWPQLNRMRERRRKDREELERFEDYIVRDVADKVRAERGRTWN